MAGRNVPVEGTADNNPFSYNTRGSGLRQKSYPLNNGDPNPTINGEYYMQLETKRNGNGTSTISATYTNDSSQPSRARYNMSVQRHDTNVRHRFNFGTVEPGESETKKYTTPTSNIANIEASRYHGNLQVQTHDDSVADTGLARHEAIMSRRSGNGQNTFNSNTRNLQYENMDFTQTRTDGSGYGRRR